MDDARQLHFEGRFDEALTAYRAIIADSDPAEVATIGAAHNNICVILMNRGLYDDALRHCTSGLELRRGVADPRTLSRALNNLGLVLQYSGDYRESERRFLEARSLNASRGDAQGETINLANLGGLATQAGWYSRAIDYLRRARIIAEAHPLQDWAPLQRDLAMVNTAVVLERLGAYRDALNLYSVVMESSSEASSSWRADILLNIGVIYRNLGDPHRALELFDEAERLFSKKDNRAGLATALLDRALVLDLNLGESVEAERFYRRALAQARANGDGVEEIRGLHYLARLLLRHGEHEEARFFFEQCLVAAERAGSSEGRWIAHAGLAGVEKTLGNGEKALEYLGLALTEIEKERARLGDQDLRSGFFATKRSVYNDAIDLLIELDEKQPRGGHRDKALSMVQRAKARSLIDELGTDAKFGAPLDADGLVASIGDEVLLEYWVGAREVRLWCVDASGVRFVSLGPPEPLMGRVERLHRRLRRGQQIADAELIELTEALIPAEVREGLAGRSLRIAPDRGLAVVPFEVLLVAPGKRLIRQSAVGYLPSGSALANRRVEEVPAKHRVIGIGDPPVDREADGAVTPRRLLLDRFALEPLPEARRELEMIRARLDPDAPALVGESATEEAVFDALRSGTRIAHFATHTVIGDGEEGATAIVLAPGPGSDGLLHPAEIAGWDLSLDLTVLSSCRSAFSPEQDRNPLATLTGAFMAAGSGAVVATLWEVGDIETRVFMEQFYHRLARGDSAAEALRRAKLRFIDDARWSDPSVWGAYILVGNGDTVSAPRPGGLRPWQMTLFLGALAIALAAVIWRWPRRRSPQSSRF